jgi:hypothetical protein
VEGDVPPVTTSTTLFELNNHFLIARPIRIFIISNERSQQVEGSVPSAGSFLKNRPSYITEIKKL